MIERRKKKTKFKWLRKLRRLFLPFVFSRKTELRESNKKRRRKRRKNKRKTPAFAEIKQTFMLWLKPQKRRRRRKKPLGKRTYHRWQKLRQNVARVMQKLLFPRKKRHSRRRKNKQYAVYVMSNQKRID